MKQALRVLNDLLAPEIASGRIEIREIEGMTIENRAAKLQSLPNDVFEEIKKCNVIIKGPMVTPRAGEPWPNLVSANKQPAAPWPGAVRSSPSDQDPGQEH